MLACQDAGAKQHLGLYYLSPAGPTYKIFSQSMVHQARSLVNLGGVSFLAGSQRGLSGKIMAHP